jgi:hypothetical protein
LSRVGLAAAVAGLALVVLGHGTSRYIGVALCEFASVCSLIAVISVDSRTPEGRQSVLLAGLVFVVVLVGLGVLAVIDSIL